MLIDRILIVGLGSIGRRHLRLAREHYPNADIRILRHQTTNEVAEYSNGSFSYLDEAIKFAPQIAVIASPASFHIPTAQALAEVGTHLLIEKPLSASLHGVLKLLKTCQKQQIVLLTGYNLRFLPSLQYFKTMLSEGAIGKVLSVRCETGNYLPYWRPEADYRDMVSARSELGGGVLLEISHEIDYLRWIFGEINWVSATLNRQSDLEIDVEDTAHLILGFAPAFDGHELIGVANLDFIRQDETRMCIAIGEKGSLRWNGLTGVVDHFEAGAKEWREVFKHPHQRDDSYISEWGDFITCVMESKTPFISGEEGVKVLQIIEAARHSAASCGRRCSVKAMHLKKDSS